MPYDKNAAIVALPPIAGSRLRDEKLSGWLSRASLERAEPQELLRAILQALGKPYPDGSLGALRMWGQTGDRPAVWMAAADPVYLEPRLDHLCQHALGEDLVPSADHRTVFDYLQETLGEGTKFGFARIGTYGYVRSQNPMATASLPALVIDQQPPNEYLPSGDDSAVYRSLRGEVEMALHDHELNVRREAEGLPPINSLWIWGGGIAPEQTTEPHPPLFADDPLLRGYWLSKTGVTGPWPGSVAECLEASVAGFVAVPAIDADDIDALQLVLHDLRQSLLAGRLSKLTLLFDDGITAEVLRRHERRFWRRLSPLLQ